MGQRVIATTRDGQRHEGVYGSIRNDVLSVGTETIPMVEVVNLDFPDAPESIEERIFALTDGWVS